MNSWTWCPPTSTLKRRNSLDSHIVMTSMWIIELIFAVFNVFTDAYACVCLQETVLWSCSLFVFAVVSGNGCRWTAGFLNMTFRKSPGPLPLAFWLGNNIFILFYTSSPAGSTTMLMESKTVLVNAWNWLLKHDYNFLTYYNVFSDLWHDH